MQTRERALARAGSPDLPSNVTCKVHRTAPDVQSSRHARPRACAAAVPSASNPARSSTRRRWPAARSAVRRSSTKRRHCAATICATRRRWALRSGRHCTGARSILAGCYATVSTCARLHALRLTRRRLCKCARCGPGSCAGPGPSGPAPARQAVCIQVVRTAEASTSARCRCRRVLPAQSPLAHSAAVHKRCALALSRVWRL